MNAVFADTGFWLGLLRKRDQYHTQAVHWKLWLDEKNARVVTTEAVLWEWLNLSASVSLRAKAAKAYLAFDREEKTEVIPFGASASRSALALYQSRPDKEWSITDCWSFVVMRQREIQSALTADHHFEQAGFRALLLANPPA